MWLELVGTGYLFSDASLTKPLTPGEEIMVDADGYSPWRRLATSGTLVVDVPSQCRVLAFSPYGELAYDSLMDGRREIPLEEGSFIGFIGSPGQAFSPTFQAEIG
ncbi:MAG: hypothetical protein GX183_01240 [Firmicutes bacterium]|nr:hypothetical protein [Bacillota bacterium]